jgi:hypothetical protein
LLIYTYFTKRVSGSRLMKSICTARMPNSRLRSAGAEDMSGLHDFVFHRLSPALTVRLHVAVRAIPRYAGTPAYILRRHARSYVAGASTRRRTSRRSTSAVRPSKRRGDATQREEGVAKFSSRRASGKNWSSLSIDCRTSSIQRDESSSVLQWRPPVAEIGFLAGVQVQRRRRILSDYVLSWPASPFGSPG